MVSANMEVPVRGTANFLPFQGGAQRLLREDGRDRWVALIPPPFSKRWAGVFGHRPFAFSISMGIKNVLDDLLSSNYSDPPSCVFLCARMDISMDTHMDTSMDTHMEMPMDTHMEMPIKSKVSKLDGSCT